MRTVAEASGVGLILAAVTAAAWLVGGLQVALGSRRIGFLRDVEAEARARPPRVSIVVAARNEAAGVRAALEDLLSQELVDVEVVVVDDRSDDGTGDILDELANRYPRLRVLHIESLPAGWLGKNHALHRGAAAASGEWLLFTDADVRFARRAAARAVAFAERRGLDHLAVAPELAMPTAATSLFAGVFVLLFARFAAPWKARDPRSRRHIGIGAFNLVRSDAYRELGGHERIRLRPDDDMMLGRLLKEAGLRQDVLYGIGQLSVEWYPTLGAAIRGLEKNAFAGMAYSPIAVAVSCGLILLLCVWPWLGLVVTEGAARALNGVAVVTMTTMYGMSTRTSGASPWLAPGIPLAFCVLCWAVIRSAALALGRGEIRWRGTAYPLDEMRRQRL